MARTRFDRKEEGEEHLKKLLLLASILALLLSQQTSWSGESQDIDQKIDIILSSYSHQRALFDNGTFKARYIQPYVIVEGATPGEMNMIEVPGKNKVTEQNLVLSSDGRFVLSLEKFIVDVKTRLRKRGAGTSRISFNGELYHSEHRTIKDEPGLGAVFSPEKSFDFSKPMIKPTFFMDHIFNDKIGEILKDREKITIREIDDRFWRLEYSDDKSEKFYHLDLDSENDFVIVKMVGRWNRRENFTKEMQYAKSEDGFYYVKRGVLTTGKGKQPVVMEVDEFKLNSYEGDFQIDIPVGTRVTDHTSGFPRVYYKGEPGKTAEETGSPSIYAIADQLDRFQMYENDALSSMTETPTAQEEELVSAPKDDLPNQILADDVDPNSSESIIGMQTEAPPNIPYFLLFAVLVAVSIVTMGVVAHYRKRA